MAGGCEADIFTKSTNAATQNSIKLFASHNGAKPTKGVTILGDLQAATTSVSSNADNFSIYGGMNVGTATGAVAGQVKANVATSGYLSFVTHAVLPNNMTTTASVPFSTSIGYACTIRRFNILAYVATTNNGSNYWSIEVCKANGTVLFTVNTNASAANTVVNLSAAGRSDALTTSDVGLFVRANKVGSPGALTLYGPALYVE